MDNPKAQDYTTKELSNKKAPPLQGEYYTKFGDMWTLNHDIRSPKFYELLINTYLKGDTDMNL